MLVLGVLAGVVTTVAGMGGGLLLLLGLSVLWDPLTALATTSPALLLGNVHRLSLYWPDLRRDLAWRLVAGALPGAAAGGLVAVSVPEAWLRGLMLAMAALALARWMGVRPRIPRGAFVPGGGAVGLVTATSGGGGLLSAPLLLSAGLTGRSYVATGAACAIAVHVGRLTGYGAGGIVDGQTLWRGGALALCIGVGNLLGDRLRVALSEAAVSRIELGVLLGCLALAVGS